MFFIQLIIQNDGRHRSSDVPFHFWSHFERFWQERIKYICHYGICILKTTDKMTIILNN